MNMYTNQAKNHVQRGRTTSSSSNMTTIVIKSQNGVKNTTTKFQIEDVTSEDIANDPFVDYKTHKHYLKDDKQIRMYSNVIRGNAHSFRGKIVLDVNCGIGILSMFAIRAGAKHVYAIDPSNIVQLTRDVVKDNNFSDVITVIQGNVDQIKLPVDQVDIIVSFFRAKFRWYESSFDSIIAARDKWLSPNGLIFPDSFSLQLTTINEPNFQNTLNYWMHVYDFNMDVIGRTLAKRPHAAYLEQKQVISDTFTLKVFDLYRAKHGDIDRIEAPFILRSRKGEAVTAFVTYFKLHFNKCHLPLRLSMSPANANTSWEQTVFLIPNRLRLNVEKKDIVYGAFRLVRHKNPTNIFEFLIKLCHKNKSTLTTVTESCEYTLKI